MCVPSGSLRKYVAVFWEKRAVAWGFLTTVNIPFTPDALATKESEFIRLRGIINTD
jgi:hypothetical protein